MAQTTYFVVQAFEADQRGALKHLQPIEAQSEGMALRRAEAMARKGGAIAFKRTGDPITGDYEDAVVLGTFGLTPAELV